MRIEVDDLSVTYTAGLFARRQTTTALNGVQLLIPAGCSMGIVGESGSGKSTLGRVLLRMLAPTRGRIRIGEQNPFALDRAALSVFRRKVQAVFQDSGASLNPRQTVGASIREGLDIHRIGAPSERRARVIELLGKVGLAPDYQHRLPHTLSGGQRQRVNIARALALAPSVLIADEPVSALDTSVQAQILELLAALRAETGLTLVFISHDLGVVRELCERVAIMHRGELVEEGAVEAVFDAPRHPVTQALLRDRPTLDLPQ
ncbi:MULTISPECIES: ABC transporter ATP-binding protein [unclassified Chelatococcus]|uniref:ATP-binding cassette domain-containing protein n=1 Tax=unclassified Chelatococcus TaxID=2638111 RepID=UPI001BCE5928|nr:ABC transporter ATP-binding protein [Chelatococcus sp.]MBS7700600.1 ABC transporter ATP-binding protein [Chelatococcus sp. YT9]MBX3558715.1 ABC transporter ATP-binding protein [Chelatococcus sp.]